MTSGRIFLCTQETTKVVSAFSVYSLFMQLLTSLCEWGWILSDARLTVVFSDVE